MTTRSAKSDMTKPTRNATTRSSPTLSILIAASAAALAQSCALAQTADRIILDENLDIQTATIFGIDARSLRLMDDGRLRRDIPLNRIIAVAPTWWATPAGSPEPPLGADTPIQQASQRLPATTDGYIETTAGTWLFGQITQPPETDSSEGQPPQRDDSIIHFNARRLGVIPVEIDNIRTIWFDAPATPNDTPQTVNTSALDANGADVVILRTGERLVGFIETVNESTVTIDDQRTGVIRTPTGRVLALRFGGPPQPSTASTIWLNDGSVIAGLTLAGDTTNEPVSARRGPVLMGSIPLTQQQLPVSIPINDIDAILLNTASVVALSSLTPTTQHPIGPRIAEFITTNTDPLSPPPPLLAADIHIPGPMEVRWQLPENATRIAFDAVLPEDCRIWGDCDVRVFIDQPQRARSAAQDTTARQQQLASFSLSGASPTHRVNAVLEPAPRRELVIRVEPGNFGPIQDRVDIRRAVILLTAP